MVKNKEKKHILDFGDYLVDIDEIIEHQHKPDISLGPKWWVDKIRNFFKNAKE